MDYGYAVRAAEVVPVIDEIRMTLAGFGVLIIGRGARLDKR